jgi:hypothetical protein
MAKILEPERMPRFWARNLALLAFGTLFALVSAEMILGVFPYPPDSQLPAHCGEVARSRAKAYEYSTIHSAYPPRGAIPVCGKEFNVIGTTDDEGYLGYTGDQRNQSNLVVFGDSFAYGYGVEQNKTFASLIGAYNAGLWGLSYPHHLVAL